MAELLRMPAREKQRGRRRERPIQDMPLADVIGFNAPRGQAETAEQKLRRIDNLVSAAASGILMAVRAVKEMGCIVRDQPAGE
jgi:hypothetical protein